MDELATLCFQLGIKFERIEGDTDETKATNLLLYLERRNRLPELTAKLEQDPERPDQFREFRRIKNSQTQPPSTPSSESTGTEARPDAPKQITTPEASAPPSGRPVLGRDGSSRPIVALVVLGAVVVVLVALGLWAASAFRNGTGDEIGDITSPTATIPSGTTVVTEGTATSKVPVADPSSPTTSPGPQAGDIRLDPRGGLEVEQVYIPAGSFLMGSEDGFGERPVHEVTLDAFWLDRAEVTNEQFAAFVAETGYETTAEREGGGWIYTEGNWTFVEGADWRHPQGPDSNLEGLDTHPVVQVSWEDAAAYAEWAGGRLPTEAEWEYAARGPQSVVYPWGNEFKRENLNYCDWNCPFNWADRRIDDGYQFTAPVGTHPGGASWVGAQDMAGNVYEWVNDWYDIGYYERSPVNNPTGLASGDVRVLRGGSWSDYVRDTRAASRSSGNPGYRSYNVGFRVAEPLSDPDS
jgi:formylglycine-generating enzyme required for sulfatase activity